MNIKKICASILTATLAVGMINTPSSLAATTTLTTPAKTITNFVNAEQGTLTYSTEYAYRGERSLHIVTDDSDTFILQAKNYFKSGGNYDIEYYINVKSADRIYTRVSWDNESNAKIYDNQILTGNYNSKTSVEAVDGASKGDGQWYKVSCTDYTGGGTADELGVFSFVGAADVYVDDLKITCKTPGWIVPSNPSTDFEEYADGTAALPTSLDKFTKVTGTGGLKKTEGAYDVAYSSFAYDGKRSMYVNTMRALYKGEESKFWIGENSDLGLENGKQYVMKFNMYPVNFAKSGGMYISACGDYRVYIQSNGNNYLYANKGTFTKIESGSKEGWYQFTGDTFTCGGTWSPQFLIVEAASEFYMDNIEFYEVTSSGIATAPTTKIDFEKEYLPANNLIATQVSGTELSVSWRNPKSSEVSNIALYDVTNNNTLKNDFDTTSDKLNEYISTDFTENTEHVYRLDITYNDGEIKSQIVGYTPKSTGWSYQAGSWNIVSSAAQKPPLMSYVDDTVYKTAAPSLKIVSNEDELNVKNAVLEVQPESTLDVNKTYRLSGYVKGDNVGYIFERVMTSSGGASAPYRIYLIHNKWNQYLTFDWKQFTTDIKPDSENAFAIMFTLSSGIQNFWIDDVTLYELDESGNPTGANLMGDRGSIDDAAAKPAAVTAGSVKNMTNAVRLRWTAADDAAYVAVYDKANSSVPVAFIPASMGYVDIPNLIGGNTYRYVLKAVNSEGREEAAGAEVVAEPEAEALIIGDFVKTQSGGNVTVSIDVKNNGYTDGVKAQLVLAVYKNKDTLTNCTSSNEITVAKSAPSAEATTLSTSITVPEGYILKAYLWDSLDGMKPLRPHSTF